MFITSNPQMVLRTSAISGGTEFWNIPFFRVKRLYPRNIESSVCQVYLNFTSLCSHFFCSSRKKVITRNNLYNTFKCLQNSFTNIISFLLSNNLAMQEKPVCSERLCNLSKHPSFKWQYVNQNKHLQYFPTFPGMASEFYHTSHNSD